MGVGAARRLVQVAAELAAHSACCVYGDSVYGDSALYRRGVGDRWSAGQNGERALQ